MSVIQEALRRKMAEQQARDEEAGRPVSKQASEAGGYAPPVLDARAPRSHASAPRQNAAFSPTRSREETAPRRDGPAVIPILMVIVLLAFAGVSLLWLQTQRDIEARRRSFEEGPPSAPVRAEAAPARTPAPARPEQRPVAQQPAPASPAPTPAPTPAPEPSSAPLMTPAPTVAATPSPPATDRPRGPVAARQESVTRDDWPRIELVGILSGGANRRNTAILNGSLVMVDAQIEGVTLAEVTEEGVYLEFMGDRQFIRIGEHTR